MPEPIPAADPNPTLSNLSGLEGVYGDQLKEDQSALADVNHDIANVPQFTEQEPRINPNGVMATMPFLVGLAALGGSFAGVHAKTMLSATNGMTKGLIQGNQKAYHDARERYQDSYQRYIDKHRQQLQIYNEMRQVYKGRVDADLRALEIARKATGDQTKVDQNALHGWQWEQENARKLEETEERQRHNRATESNTTASVDERTRHNVAVETKVAKGTPAQQVKAQEKDAQVSRARQLIKELKEMAGKQSSIAGIPAGVTGVTGHAARISESVGNALGMSDETVARDFESKNSELQLLLPKLLTGSSKSAKDERDKVATIARGLKFGDTPQNTVSALEELDRSLSAGAAPADRFEVGKAYKDAKGNTAIYKGNGQWQPQPKK